MTPYQRQVIRAMTKMVDFEPLRVYYQLNHGKKLSTEDAEDIAELIFANINFSFIHEKMVEIKSYDLEVPGFDADAWGEVYMENIRHNREK